MKQPTRTTEGFDMSTPPINWIPPDGFNFDAEDLGLKQLEGISHRTLYDPEPCRANVDEGGDGVYESVLHGTYNHHPTIILYRDTFIVTWTNHSRDENGPGQRVLGRTGIFNDDRQGVDFGDRAESISELAPQPIPLRRRPFDHDPNEIHPYANGSLRLINDSLYFLGNLIADHGYTRDEKNRRPTEPLPESEYSDVRDFDAGFWYFNTWFDIGLRWVQKWDVREGRLIPTTPMYHTAPLRTEIEVTPGRVKTVAELLPAYNNMLPYDEADSSMKDDLENGVPVSFDRTPRYRPGESFLSADGIHALAHQAEFLRPDGTWVVLRDNLLKGGHYYAAEKPREEDFYPPAVETDIYGGAQMIAGELPDGRPWMICNSCDDDFSDIDRSRKHMYLTLSDDGRTFDRTWLLLYVERESDGGIYKGGGPQYYKHVVVGDNIWVVYSITKEKVGMTKIPMHLFDGA
jgi:hypothetical protein